MKIIHLAKPIQKPIAKLSVTEQELIERCKREDRTAQRILFDKYFKNLPCDKRSILKKEMNFLGCQI